VCKARTVFTGFVHFWGEELVPWVTPIHSFDLSRIPVGIPNCSFLLRSVVFISVACFRRAVSDERVLVCNNGLSDSCIRWALNLKTVAVVRVRTSLASW
jgi:hypothetical protein